MQQAQKPALTSDVLRNDQPTSGSAHTESRRRGGLAGVPPTPCCVIGVGKRTCTIRRQAPCTLRHPVGSACQHPSVLQNREVQEEFLASLQQVASALTSTASPTYSTCKASCIAAQQPQKPQVKASQVQVRQVPCSSLNSARRACRLITCTESSTSPKTRATAKLIAPTAGSVRSERRMKTAGSLQNT